MMTLQQLAEKADLQYIGNDMTLPPINIDSRMVKSGDLFVAIVGPNFDGHHYVEQAIAQGAAAILVDHQMDITVPQMIASDTTLALRTLAQLWRQQFNVPLIGLTGSCGKTTTKQMLVHIVAELSPALVTQGNYNNAIGLPLTLLGLRPEHRYAVIEMGTNGPGEIPYLANIAKPTVSMITNIRASHLEGLGSLAGIAQEKGAIYDHLDSHGTAIINSDEPFVTDWQARLAGQSVITFACEADADVTAHDLSQTALHSQFVAKTPRGPLIIELPIPGQHQISNALAAIAAAIAADIPTQAIQQGLANMQAVKGRFHPYHLQNGALLIDDTYNASTSAVKSAIEALGQHPGKRLFVMSNMSELGDHAAHYHQAMGRWANEHPLDVFWLYGDENLLQHTLQACTTARYFADKTELAEALRSEITKDSMVIIKGSRANKMEDIIKVIIEE